MYPPSPTMHIPACCPMDPWLFSFRIQHSNSFELSSVGPTHPRDDGCLPVPDCVTAVVSGAFHLRPGLRTHSDILVVFILH